MHHHHAGRSLLPAPETGRGTGQQTVTGRATGKGTLHQGHTYSIWLGFACLHAPLCALPVCSFARLCPFMNQLGPAFCASCLLFVVNLCAFVYQAVPAFCASFRSSISITSCSPRLLCSCFSVIDERFLVNRDRPRERERDRPSDRKRERDTPGHRDDPR